MTASAEATSTAAALSGAAAVRPFWSRTSVRVIGGLVVPLALLGLWQAVTAFGLIPTYRLPAPLDVVNAATRLADDGALWLYIGISVQRVVLGFLFGSLIGLAFAAVVGLSRSGDVLLSPILAAFRAIPSLALVPLVLLWMGTGEESKVVLVAIGAFFPVFTTVAGALRHVDPHFVEMGRSFGLRGWELFRSVQLPATVPPLVSGLRLALAQSWLFLVAAEMLGASMGLGFLLDESRQTGRVDRIFLAIVILAILGALSNALVTLLQRRVLRRWS